jgi:hypothetical protein
MRSLRSAFVVSCLSFLPAAARATTPTPTPAPTEITPPASRVTASTHDGNVPGNTVDNNLGTRWSAGGDGQWIQYDLGGTAWLQTVSIAVYHGDQRKNRFDLLTSTDGAAWRNVIVGGSTSGTTTAEETYNVNDWARYVRYVGHGHVTNDGMASTMNSLTEVDMVGAIAPPPPPPGPTGFTAGSTGDGIDLKWDPLTGASYYRLYRTTDGFNFTRLYSGLTGTTHRDRDHLTPGMRYYYRVTAVVSARESGPSITASAVAPYGGFVEITPPAGSVTASTWDGPNVAANVVDNDLATRWSANGDGAWLRMTLPATSTLAFAKVAMFAGTTRRARFELQGSTDGVTWMTLVAGQSSGTTDQEETYEFADTPARYVRYIGHGTTVSTWNGVTEISLFAPGCTPAPPAPTPPPAPTGVTAAPGDAQVTVGWTVNPNSGSGSGYYVYRSLTAGGPYDTIVGGGAPPIVDRNVVNGTTYYYVVREYRMYMAGYLPPCPHTDEIVYSPPSSEVSVVPGTSNPTPIQVTPGPAAVSASTNDGNAPGNSVDDNLATRWSGYGDGAWIQYDLGMPRTVTHLSVGVYRGNERSNQFDLLASDDGQAWAPLRSGISTTGTTTAQEEIDVPDTLLRYLRYVGHGSSVGAWNSVTEVDIFALP